MTPRLYPALQADSLPLSHRGSPTRDCYSAIKRNEGLIHATSFCPHHPFWLSLFWSYGHLSSKSLALRFLCSKYLERLLLRSCSSAELSLCVFIVHTTQLQREEDGEWLLWQCLNQRRTLGKWNLFSASTHSGSSGTKPLVQECLGDRGEREVCVSLWATETMGRRQLNILLCLSFHNKRLTVGWL